MRKEVPTAVHMCKEAGIVVRMVTGDNVHTAKHIARECGILDDDGITLEGPVFREMTEEQLMPLLPKLQVGVVVVGRGGGGRKGIRGLYVTVVYCVFMCPFPALVLTSKTPFPPLLSPLSCFLSPLPSHYSPLLSHATGTSTLLPQGQAHPRESAQAQG